MKEVFDNRREREQLLDDWPNKPVAREQLVEAVPIEYDPVIEEVLELLRRRSCAERAVGCDTDVLSMLECYGPVSSGEIVGALPGKAGLMPGLLRVLEAGGIVRSRRNPAGVVEYELRDCD